jgi:hypothetical protein
MNSKYTDNELNHSVVWRAAFCNQNMIRVRTAKTKWPEASFLYVDESTDIVRAHKNNVANFGNMSLYPGDFNLGIATEGTFLVRKLEIIRIKKGPNLIMSMLN